MDAKRRAEIEAMCKLHGDYLVFRNMDTKPTRLEPCAAIIRELLAEIDRLSQDVAGLEDELDRERDRGDSWY